MPLTTVQDYVELVGDYLTGVWPLPQLSGVDMLARIEIETLDSEDQRSSIMSHLLTQKIQSLTILEQADFIGHIDVVVMVAKQDHLERVNCLKNHLCQFGQCDNWKDALFGLNISEQQNIYYKPLHFNNTAEHPIAFDDQRFLQIPSPTAHELNSYAIIGKTFVTNKARDMMDETMVNRPLDAITSVYTFNTQGEINGLVVALADGCGGHFGDEHQDQAIARSAHFACKQAVRLLAAYSHPEVLLAEVEEIITAVGDEIRRKTPNWQEGTTLIAGRAYPIKEGYRFVGFNVGDSMMIAWNPLEQTFRTLAPARTSVYESGQEATAIVPHAYKTHEINVIDTQLSAGTIVMPLSDGVYEHLSCEKTTQSYPDDTIYHETTLDTEITTALFAAIPEDAPVSIYLQTLITEAVNRVELIRQEKLAQSMLAQTGITEIEAEIHAQEQALQQSGEALESLHKSDWFGKRMQSLMELQSKRDIQVGDDIAVSAIPLPPCTTTELVEPRSKKKLKKKRSCVLQ